MMLLPFSHHHHYNSAMDENLTSLPSSFDSLTSASSSPSSMTDILLHPFLGIHTHSTPISLSTPCICNNCSIYATQPLGLWEVQHPCAFLSNPRKVLQFNSLRAHCCRCRGMSSCSPSLLHVHMPLYNNNNADPVISSDSVTATSASTSAEYWRCCAQVVPRLKAINMFATNPLRLKSHTTGSKGSFQAGVFL